MARVLVTGSAGGVGRPVCAGVCARGHAGRAFDRQPTPGEHDSMVADIADPPAVREAMRGIHTVVHLAAEPHDVPFEQLLAPNVAGLYNVMSAARDEQV